MVSDCFDRALASALAFDRALASALALSHLDNCSLVYLDVSDELQTRLQRLQNSCVRYVRGARRDEHISPYRTKLDWLDLQGRRSYFTAVLMYKTLNLGQPAYLKALFQTCQTRTSGRTAARDLTVPSSRTDMGFNSFKSQGTRIWNHIPRNIKYLYTTLTSKS